MQTANEDIKAEKLQKMQVKKDLEEMKQDNQKLNKLVNQYRRLLVDPKKPSKQKTKIKEKSPRRLDFGIKSAGLSPTNQDLSVSFSMLSMSPEPNQDSINLKALDSNKVDRFSKLLQFISGAPTIHEIVPRILKYRAFLFYLILKGY